MGKKKNSRKEFPQRWCWCSLISLRVVALKASRTIINLSDTKVGACIAKQTQIQKHQNTQIQKNTRRRRTIMCCAIWKQIKQKLRRTIETLCTCYRLTHWPTDHSHRPTRPTKPTQNPHLTWLFLNFVKFYTICTIGRVENGKNENESMG